MLEHYSEGALKAVTVVRKAAEQANTAMSTEQVLQAIVEQDYEIPALTLSKLSVSPDMITTAAPIHGRLNTEHAEWNGHPVEKYLPISRLALALIGL